MTARRESQDRDVQPPNAALSAPSLQGLQEDDADEDNGALLQQMYEQSGERAKR